MLPGQKYLLEALSRQPTTQVLLVIGWSKPNDVQVNTIYKVSTDKLTELSIPENQTGVDKLKSLIRIWYDWVSR
jgi:hypothetical protein